VTIVTYERPSVPCHDARMSESEEIVRKFAALVRKRRLEKGLSHERLAEMAGLDRSSISLYEAGKRVPTLTSAMRIARALEMRLSELVGEIEGQ